MTETSDRIAELERELAKIKDIVAQAFLAGALLARERDEALAKLKVYQEAVENMHGAARAVLDVAATVPSFLITAPARRYSGTLLYPKYGLCRKLPSLVDAERTRLYVRPQASLEG